MYKSINGLVPTYVSDLIPLSVGEISTYTLRNQHKFTVPLCWTEILRKSCIPSSIFAWNSLDIELRSSPSLASFKYQLKKHQNNSSVPTYYQTGSRYLSVLHSRIINNCSNLLSDLYINYLSRSPTCSCSEEVEDADHYFFNCPNFNNERDALLRATRDFYPLNIYILLFGDEYLTAEENTIIFTFLLVYIVKYICIKYTNNQIMPYPDH